MKATIRLKNSNSVVTIEELTQVNIRSEKFSDKIAEFTTEKLSKIPLCNNFSYVFVGKKTIAISGAEILYAEFE